MIEKMTPTNWSFLTNHSNVLLCVARDSGIRLRDIAATVGITERSAHKILNQLVEDDYVIKERVGRRNTYLVQTDKSLNHPLVDGADVGELLKLLAKGE